MRHLVIVSAGTSQPSTTRMLADRIAAGSLERLREMEVRRAPGVPDAPTHAGLVSAKYGDSEPRQARPNPNRGDNLTGPTPYQDTDLAA